MSVNNREAFSLRHSLRALEHRNYRLFFSGQSVSLIGTWLTRIATGWLVFRLTHSPVLLGLVGFAGQIPTFILAPFAGVLSDKWNRHRILVATQTLLMVQSFALAWFVLSGTVSVGIILALSAFQGIVNAFDTPARQSFVVDMVETRTDLPNAIALNSTMFNGARLVGPSVAGILIGAFGEGICFLIDGFSYIAVILSLVSMRNLPQREPAKKHEGGIFGELKEGFDYAFGFAPIRTLLLLLALVSLMGMPYTVLMPVFAGTLLHGGPHTLGYLMGASGIGALCGAIFLATRRSVLGLGRIIPMASTLFGAGLIAFSFSRVMWLSMPLMVLTGFGMIVQMASSNTILQTIVEDTKRGRVMSFYTMAFFGTAPFGSLLAGTLADWIGAPYTVALGGACCVAGAAVFASKLPELRKMVRPIYHKLGILPELRKGMQMTGAFTTPPED